MKKGLIGAGIILVGGAALFVYLHPILLKALTGTARVLSPPLNCSVKVEGNDVPGAKCFAMKTLFDGKPADSIVLWVPEPSALYGRAIFIIERRPPFVGRPNHSETDYYLLWGRFLFQSESGSFNVPFVKDGNYRDPQLEVTDRNIKFRVHSAASYLPGKYIEVNYE